MIDFRGVGKSYDGFRALRPLSLEVADGEVVVLVGPNGAGKSTLLKMAAGMLRPSEGQVLLGRGGAASRPASARARTGYLPENAACYDDLTARENLEYFCILRGLSGAALDKRVRELLATVDLAGEKKLVRQFSKGMRQRLAIAISLAGDPSVVLWDEPSSGLDPSGRLLLRKLIAGLKRAGASVLISSHDLRESALLADRVCLISRGEVKFLGTADGPRLEEIYSKEVGGGSGEAGEEEGRPGAPAGREEGTGVRPAGPARECAPKEESRGGSTGRGEGT